MLRLSSFFDLKGFDLRSLDLKGLDLNDWHLIKRSSHRLYITFLVLLLMS